MTPEQIAEARVLLAEILERTKRLDEIIDQAHRTEVRKRYGMSAWQRLLGGTFELDSALESYQRNHRADLR